MFFRIQNKDKTQEDFTFAHTYQHEHMNSSRTEKTLINSNVVKVNWDGTVDIRLKKIGKRVITLYYRGYSSFLVFKHKVLP